MTPHKTKKNRPKLNIKKTCTKKHRKKQIDFYNYVNKHWFEHHRHIPKSRNETNPFILLQNKVNNQIKNIVLKKIYREKTKSAMQVKNIYNACIKTSDSQIETHILGSISTLKYLREQGDMYALFAWYTKSGFQQLFNWSVEIDEKKPTQYISRIQESGLSLPSKDIYIKNTEESKERKAEYLRFLRSMFSLAFGKSHPYNIEKIYHIEQEIAHFLYEDDQIRNFDLVYNVFNEKTIQKDCHFDWSRFCPELSTADNIIVENPKYLKHIMTILSKNWSSEDWNNYWVYQILLTASKFHSKLYELNYRFFTTSNISHPSASQRAIIMVEKIMNTEINKKYLEYYKNTREIAFAKTIFLQLKHVLKERIKANSWLSAKTIEKVTHKLNNMRPTIGYKPDWQPDPDDEFNSLDSFANYQTYMLWLWNRSIEKLRKKRLPPNDVWTQANVFDVNAFYSNNKNEIILPNAILQPPFIDIGKSMAYNYANMGTIIAHEMIHALDEDGCNYDEHGVRDNKWFSTEEMKVYKQKQRDIMKYYEVYAKKDGEFTRPNVTIGENISDIGGFLVAEQAYIKQEQEPNMNEFYRLYAEKWKTIMKPKWLHQLYQNDIHSLAKYRVNSVLSFSEGFNQIYNGEKPKTGSPW